LYIGIDSIDINMEMQKVTVMGWADEKKVLKTVRKTGRRAEYGHIHTTQNTMTSHAITAIFMIISLLRLLLLLTITTNMGIVMVKILAITESQLVQQ
jgi:hypothetical protein